MTKEPERIIAEAFQAWSSLDIERITQCFSEDAVFHNIPLEPAIGRQAIRQTVEGLFGGLLRGVTRIKIVTLRTASNGKIVFDERVDSFELNGKWVSIPVVGIFEVHDSGQIKAWRDYFDLENFMKQLH